MEVKDASRASGSPNRVRVYVRARPLVSKDEKLQTPLSYPASNQLKVRSGRSEDTYNFDYVFSAHAENKEVCDMVCPPLIEMCLSGCNSSFMVYGQTGTGKTHTVLSEDGLIQQTLERLFHKIESEHDWRHTVALSYLQIYQDRIHDLLEPWKCTSLVMREHPVEGVVVEGLSERFVSTVADAIALVRLGQKNLIVAETKMVRVSSRSHSLLMLKICKGSSSDEMQSQVEVLAEVAVKQPHREIQANHSFPVPVHEMDTLRPTSVNPAKRIKSKLFICDLAGSERLRKTLVSGERLREARYINTSLLELGNVIHALSASRQPHIPFRNSTLTRLLKESLGGNSFASLMVCISSSARDINETKHSLGFGERAMRVTKHSIPCVEIDYKTLAENLTLKLKKLETAYELEKESLAKMISRNMRHVSPGSGIPVKRFGGQSRPSRLDSWAEGDDPRQISTRDVNDLTLLCKNELRTFSPADQTFEAKSLANVQNLTEVCCQSIADPASATRRIETLHQSMMAGATQHSTCLNCLRKLNLEKTHVLESQALLESHDKSTSFPDPVLSYHSLSKKMSNTSVHISTLEKESSYDPPDKIISGSCESTLAMRSGSILSRGVETESQTDISGLTGIIFERQEHVERASTTECFWLDKQNFEGRLSDTGLTRMSATGFARSNSFYSMDHPSARNELNVKDVLSRWAMPGEKNNEALTVRARSFNQEDPVLYQHKSLEYVSGDYKHQKKRADVNTELPKSFHAKRRPSVTSDTNPARVHRSSSAPIIPAASLPQPRRLKQSRFRSSSFDCKNANLRHLKFLSQSKDTHIGHEKKIMEAESNALLPTASPSDPLQHLDQRNESSADDKNQCVGFSVQVNMPSEASCTKLTFERSATNCVYNTDLSCSHSSQSPTLSRINAQSSGQTELDMLSTSDGFLVAPLCSNIPKPHENLTTRTSATQDASPLHASISKNVMNTKDETQEIESETPLCVSQTCVISSALASPLLAPPVTVEIELNPSYLASAPDTEDQSTIVNFERLQLTENKKFASEESIIHGKHTEINDKYGSIDGNEKVLNSTDITQTSIVLENNVPANLVVVRNSSSFSGNSLDGVMEKGIVKQDSVVELEGALLIERANHFSNEEPSNVCKVRVSYDLRSNTFKDEVDETIYPSCAKDNLQKPVAPEKPALECGDTSASMQQSREQQSTVMETSLRYEELRCFPMTSFNATTTPFGSVDSLENNFFDRQRRAEKALKHVQLQYQELLDQFILLNQGSDPHDCVLDHSRVFYDMAQQVSKDLDAEISRARLELKIAAQTELTSPDLSSNALGNLSTQKQSASNDEAVPSDQQLKISSTLPPHEDEITADATHEIFHRPETLNSVLGATPGDANLQLRHMKGLELEGLRELHTDAISSQSNKEIVQTVEHLLSQVNSEHLIDDVCGAEYKCFIPAKSLLPEPMGLDTASGIRSGFSVSDKLTADAFSKHYRSSKIVEELGPGHMRWIRRNFAFPEEEARRSEKLALAAIENAAVKKELLLTKLEKIRLEAVLSCVMMKNQPHGPSGISREFKQLSFDSMKSLTLSHGTLASSASCAQLPTSPRIASSIPPLKPDDLKKCINSATNSSTECSISPVIPRRLGADSKNRSVQTDVVTSWLTRDYAEDLTRPSTRLRSSASSNLSSDFDVSSLSVVSMRSLATRPSPCGQDREEDFRHVADGTVGEPSVDGLQPVTMKKEKSNRFWTCLPFLRKRRSQKDLGSG